LIIVAFLTSIFLFRYSLFYNARGAEGWFLSFTCSLIILSLLSWILMRAGVYSIAAVTILLMIPAIALYLKQKKRQAHIFIRNDDNVGHCLLLSLVFLSFGVFYALYPTYYLLGGRDPGLYLTFAVHIAKTGGLNLDLPIMRDLYTEYGNAFRLGYPGIYSAFTWGLSEDPARLIPQFMHLFPSFAANFYSAFGLEGVVRANAVVAIFALWSFFMVCRRLMPYWPALLATVALGINPALIWNARITLTETMAMGILLLGVYLVFIAKERKSIAWGMYGGIVLGTGMLNRLDASLNVLVILGFSLYASLEGKRLRRVALYSALVYVLISTIGFIDGYVNTYPYVYDLWHSGSLKGLIFLNYAGALISLVLLSLPKTFLGKLRFTQRTLYYVMLVATGMMVAWLLFAYFIWPLLADGFNTRAMRELGWYVTPLAFILFALGFGSAVRERNWDVWLPLLVLAGFCVFIFTWRPSITPDHIWASRRWVPHVIPLIILFSAYGMWKLCSILVNQSHKYAAAGVILVIIVSYLMSAVSFARPYFSQSILEGYPAQYSDFSKSINVPVTRPCLTQNMQLASILTYIYEINTALITKTGVSLAKKGKFNMHLFVGLDSFSFPNWSDDDNLIYQGNLCGSYLQKIRGFRPIKLYTRRYTLDTCLLSVDTKDLRINIDVPVTHHRFISEVGFRNENKGTIMSNGKNGFLQFGPYISLPPGHYVVEWFGTVMKAKGDPIGFVDVVTNKGARLIKREPVLHLETSDQKGEPLSKIDFSLESKVSDLEYRFYVNEGTQVILKNIRLKGNSEGVHCIAETGL